MLSPFLGRPIRNFLALSVTVVTLTAVSFPARAGDGGAVAAGILGGTALGVLAGAAIATAPPPPPPSLCPAATAAALLVRTARGVDRLRLCNPAGARLYLMGRSRNARLRTNLGSCRFCVSGPTKAIMRLLPTAFKYSRESVLVLSPPKTPFT
jgi:hypothetical protein